MALGLQTESGGGDYADILKYDARAGRMFRVDRSNVGGQWQTDNVEVTDGFVFVPDLDNIQVGWALFAAGMAPQFTMVPLGDPLPHKPSDLHKQGFKIMVKLGQKSGDDIREFASCAKVVIGALDTLHNEYVKQKVANPGQLPVVALTGSTAVVSSGKGQSSTNYAPVFQIVKWVDRLDGLGAPTSMPTASPPPQTPPPQTPPPQVAAAPVQQVKKPEMAGQEF